MVVQNNTHYFSQYTRIFNALPDPNSFQLESGKRMGYFQRLWFEYAYTRKVNGMCFYYTLTYNDAHIPKYRGRNCFSYDDIRKVTNGVLSKVLLRKYGSVLRYFCACETGEGKGVRGLGNNPHYHFIFFVYPCENCKFEYKPITPQEFKDLIYTIWQGKPSDVFVPWQLAKFGHVQEGLYNGEVLSPDAFKYVGKYVTKESDERCYENQLKIDYRKEFIGRSLDWSFWYLYYKYLRLVDSGVTSRSDFFDWFPLHEYWLYRYSRKQKGLPFYSFSQYLNSQGQICKAKYDLAYQWFTNFYVPQCVEEELAKYRNLYGPKCRMSKTLGIYGLNFIELIDGQPRVVLNTSKGYEVQYPCLYYIRKLFYDVKICSFSGNPLYYLNDFGVKMKMSTIKQSIDNYKTKTIENVSFAQLNHVDIPQGNLPCGFNEVFSRFLKSPDQEEILRRYSIYHHVYQYRSFDKYVYLTDKCLLDDVLLDYSIFLNQNSYYLDFQTGSVFDMVRKKLYPSFSSHPAFLPYIDYFNMLDSLNDTVSSIVSSNRKKEFSAKSAHMKRLNAYRYSSIFPFSELELPFCPPSASSEYPIYTQLSLFA